MTNQDIINKLNQFPKDKQIVFFCNQDVFLEQEFVWNECFIEDIKECLYIEYDDKIFNFTQNLKEYLEYHTDWDDDLINKIIKTTTKKEVIRIDLNIT
jgi:hypothetical protein